MAKSVKDANSVELMKIEPNKIAEIETLKTEVLEVVEKHPYIQIKDSKTYKAAIESRKALRDISLKVEKQDSTIASFFVGLRKQIGTFLVGDEVGINKLSRVPFDKQDKEVKRWEKVQQEFKDEQERIANKERQNKISEINEIVLSLKDKISKMTYDSIETEKLEIEKTIKERKGTFGIYDVYFDPHVNTFYDLLKEKINALVLQNQQKESERIEGVQNQINEIESTVKNLILTATFESIQETETAITELVSMEFDFQEFESDFENKSDELFDLWKKKRQDLEDLQELTEIRSGKIYDTRSKILVEIGMDVKENGDFFVHDLDYLKQTIIKDSDEHFERTVENIKRFIAGENAKPSVQLIEDDEPKPTIESIQSTETHMLDSMSFAVEGVKENNSFEGTKNKIDFVAIAEQKMQNDDTNMGGQSAFNGAKEMLKDVEQFEVDLTENGTAQTVGELIDLLVIMEETTPLFAKMSVTVENGKVIITEIQ